jgi:hypothetical protein
VHPRLRSAPSARAAWRRWVLRASEQRDVGAGT